MKKERIVKNRFNKLVIGILLILVVAAAAANNELVPGKTAAEQKPRDYVIVDQPQDYTISESISILIKQDNYVHTDGTVVIGILKEIVFANETVNRFIIQGTDKNKYTILYRDLELISTQITKTQKEHNLDAVHLVFRTGGEVTLTEGEEAVLYQDVDGAWSPDRREHKKSDSVELTGTVEDFKFLPISDREDDIYLSSIIIKSAEDKTAELYPHNLGVKFIKSQGDLTVYYAGDVSQGQVFDVDEADDFAVVIRTDKYTYTLKKGESAVIVQNESKGYWEIVDEIDTGTYEAVVEGFEFGWSDEDITSIDYINVLIGEEEKVQLTMMQTQALFALPYGDYKKIFTYQGHDKVLTDIEPLEGWKMELYYEDGTVLELNEGAQIWVLRNDDGIWVVDYTCQEYDKEEEVDEGG